MQKGLVSVITVNYNGFKDTCEFLDSFRENETYPLYQLIVVDNASRENEAARIQSLYPWVRTVRSETNLGFAGGNDLGLQLAEGEYILYQNNDMIIREPFLDALVQRLKTTPGAGLVSPKIKYAYAPDTIQYAGFTPMRRITVKNTTIGARQKDAPQYDIPAQTAFVHGACMLTSREVLQKAGGMTHVYFLFYEELDWSLQVKRAGFSIWYEPSATVYHKESMSIPRQTPLRNYYLYRSRLLFVRRNTGRIEKVVSCLYLLLVSYPANVLRFLYQKDWENIRAISRGTFAGLLDCRG